MSQQGPGGYGGGGPYGPPGGGGYGGQPPGGGYPPPGGAPPGGGYPPPGGGPPGGYGPPGGPPPGYGGPPAGGPPGYGPAPQGYGGYPGGPPGPPGPPAKKSKALLFVGLGCGGLILLGSAGGIASYLYMKSKVSDAETAIANLASAGAGSLPTLPTPAAGTISAACAKAIACCKAITSKTAANNSALVDQACNGIGLLSDAQCTQQFNALKTSAAAVHATCE